MNTPSIRIGIDVGGTFTDAVAIDDGTRELLAQVKVPTTHSAPQGVALGILQALQQLMQATGIAPDQIRFIAHGTTQATNALLEGDVVTVGILATGKGLEGKQARAETAVDDIELAPGRALRIRHAFAGLDELPAALATLQEQGTRVIVAAEAFSVDDPTGELRIMQAASDAGLAATGTHEISKLYGLRMRTRTAAINASILPRMVDTSNMTESAVQSAGIASPLMIMRGDGGVMTVAEMRRRPILTMLSGPAAGVAGALMYERISDGIFLEVGGTSTDISAVRGGRVMVEYAEVGGHRTYVSSLDVRTVGVAGGSMMRVAGGRLVDIGPRSAHIAGLDYAVYADPVELEGATLECFAPLEGDPADYVCVRGAKGRRFALTTACAANLLGYVHDGDYARGNADAARLGFAPLAEALGCDIEEAARRALRAAAAKIEPVVRQLMQRYELEREHTVLVGGGGGCATVVPMVAEIMGLRGKMARNHQVISPIGVALAMVRDVVERTIPYPTQEDILRVRKEAEDAALRAGAARGTVEVQVEIDSTRNIVRAIATGATELRTGDPGLSDLTAAELLALATESAGLETMELAAQTDRWHIYAGRREEKALFGLTRRIKWVYRVLDAQGIVRLKLDDALLEILTAGQAATQLPQILARHTIYGDSGAILPATYAFCGARMLDFSGLQAVEQVVTMAKVELADYAPEEPLVVICSKRK